MGFNAHTLSIVGLILNLLSSVLITLFGIPKLISEKGTQYLVLEQIDEAEAKLGRRYKILSAAGMVLMFLGFAIQLYAAIEFRV